MKRASSLVAAAMLVAAFAFADNGTPLARVWNISPTGSADSSGALRFRVKPDDGEPVDISVPVVMGANAETIARGIRRALSSQLSPDRFNVQLGEGSNVMVSDTRGRPHFSLELVNSDVDNLRIAVQSVTPAASPTVPSQSQPTSLPAQRPPTNDGPGDTLPPPSESMPVPPPAPATQAPAPAPAAPPSSPSAPAPSPAAPGTPPAAPPPARPPGAH